MRGFSLLDQIKSTKLPSNYSEVNMTINLSQDTQHIFDNDHDFINLLQEQQKEVTLSSSMFTNTYETESVIKIRKIFNVVRDEGNLRNMFIKDIDALYTNYISKGR